MIKVQQMKDKVSPTNSHLWAGLLPSNTPVVGVNWRDIQYVDNWNTDEEVAPARYLFTVGYLLYEGPDPKDAENDITVIAGTYNYDSDKWADFTVFPSVVVRQIVALMPAPKKRKAKNG